MLIVVRDVHPKKAELPIIVRDEDGSNVTDVNTVCPANKESEISNTAGPIMTDDTVHPENRV